MNDTLKKRVLTQIKKITGAAFIIIVLLSNLILVNNCWSNERLVIVTGFKDLSHLNVVHPDLLLAALSENLRVRLNNIKGVSVLTRDNGELNALLEELNFQETAWVDQLNTIKKGKFKGAHFVVFGKVIRASQEIINQLPLKLYKTTVEISVKVINLKTGQLEESAISKAVRSDSQVINENTHKHLSGIQDFGPVYEQLAISAVKDAVSKIKRVLQPPIIIFSINGKFVNINGGIMSGLQLKEVYDVYRPGPKFTDPTTGAIMQSKSFIGKIKIVKLERNMAIGKIKKGKKEIQINDIISQKKL